MFHSILLSLLLSTAVFQFSSGASVVDDLKQEVLLLAKANMTNIESRPVVRTQLEVLVRRLQNEVGAVTEEQVLQYSPGGWQQIWADEADMSPPGAPAQDLAQIYQYINPQGWGYNFGLRRINENIAITFALAVSGSVKGNLQTTRINRAYSRNSALIEGESLEQLSHEIESGTSPDFIFRDAGEFPNGPIGAQSVLTILYLDEDLKIGTAPNVYTGEIEMFVLERTSVVRFLNEWR